jgi:hypothetical protein
VQPEKISPYLTKKFRKESQNSTHFQIKIVLNIYRFVNYNSFFYIIYRFICLTMHFEALLLRLNFSAHPAEKFSTRVGNPPLFLRSTIPRHGPAEAVGIILSGILFNIIHSKGTPQNWLYLHARRCRLCSSFCTYCVTGSVADPDPGSSAFLIPGSGARICESFKEPENLIPA